MIDAGDEFMCVKCYLTCMKGRQKPELQLYYPISSSNAHKLKVSRIFFWDDITSEDKACTRTFLTFVGATNIAYHKKIRQAHDFWCMQ